MNESERERYDDALDAVNFADGPCDVPFCYDKWTHAETAVVMTPGGAEVEVIYLCDKHVTGAVQ
jgi:hypothetical protein